MDLICLEDRASDIRLLEEDLSCEILDAGFLKHDLFHQCSIPVIVSDLLFYFLQQIIPNF